MKIIVMSDSHGDFYSLDEIMSKHKDADIVIHFGDSHGEIDKIKADYPDIMYYCVKGNCDLGSTLETQLTIDIAGHRLFITHGHLFNAKFTIYNLVCAAKEQDADILLFGHTHSYLSEYDDSLYIMNPGSCHGRYGTYGIIEIINNDILPSIAKVEGGVIL